MDAESRSRIGTGAGEDENILSLGEVLRVLWRRLWVVLLVTACVVGAATAYTLTREPVYEASVQLLVGQVQDPEGGGNLANDVQGLQQLAQTMAEAADSRPVAEAVIGEMSLRITPEEFLEDVEVQLVTDTQFIEVSYRDVDPEVATQIANTIGDVFSGQVSEVSPNANAVTVTVWEQAGVPVAPISPDPVRNLLLALVLGGVLGVGLAFLREYLDDSWQSPEEVELISGAPALGIVPEYKVPKFRRGA